MNNIRYSLLISFCFVLCLKSAAQMPVIEWQQSLGGSFTESAQAMFRTADSGYVVAGHANSLDGDVTGLHGTQYDFWVVKLSPTGSIQWQKALGGTGSELARSIVQTKDKGYIVAGYGYSSDGDVSGNHGNADYWVVKLDDTGRIQWQRSLGGSDIDMASSVLQTIDSGYLVAGRSDSHDGDVTAHHDSADCWIVKLSKAGTIEWEKSLGGSRGEGASTIKQTLDSGYIVVGATNSTDGDVSGNHGKTDAWIIKLSQSGNIQWEKTFGGSGNDYANAIEQTADSGYIVAGNSNSADGDVTGNQGDYDYWILKLSKMGDLVWQTSLGGGDFDIANDVKQVPDGSYIVSGITFSNDGNVTELKGMSDSWVTKLSATGSLQWEMTLGGTRYDGAYSIAVTADSQYVVAGYSASADGDVAMNHGDSDYWVVKLGNHLAINQVAPVTSLPLSVMPNPTISTLNVKSGATINQLTISDISGKAVRSGQYNSKEVLIDVSSLPSGLYLVNVNGVVVERFIKQ